MWSASGCGHGLSPVSMKRSKISRRRPIRRFLTLSATLFACSVLLFTLQTAPQDASGPKWGQTFGMNSATTHASTGPEEVADRYGPTSNSESPYVASTLVLANNSLLSGNFVPANPEYPMGVVYDNSTGQFFVTDYLSANVTVINASTQHVVSDIAVGNSPWGLAYDEGRGEIFVANFGSNTVSVISDTSDRVVATVSVWYQPEGVVYEAARGEVYVTNSNGYASSPTMGNVSVISGSTNSVVENITVGEYPTSIAYDTGTQELFVTNSGSNNVSVISGSSNRVVATIAVGTSPQSVSYDRALAELFVANSGTLSRGNVTVIDDRTNATVASIPVSGSPFGVLYDNDSQTVFVASYGTNNVSIINASTATVIQNLSVGQNPTGLALDNDLGQIWVTNTASNNLTAISDSTDTVVATIWLNEYPSAEAYDSGQNRVFVTVPGPNTLLAISDANRTESAVIPVGSLPNGVAYDNLTGDLLVANYGSNNVSVLSDKTYSTVAQIQVRSGPDRLALDASTGNVYVSDLDSNNVTVISGQTNSVLGTIAVGQGPAGVAYDPETESVYVADSGTDSIEVIAGSSDSVSATIRTGSSPIDVAYDNGTGELFVANFDSNTVSVLSESTNVVLANIPVGSHPSALAYDSNTGEVFVANSYSGNISVISDTTDTVVATVPVQSEPSDVVYDSGERELYVANSGSGAISIISTNAGTYDGVSFSESGLPAGTTWSMYLNNTTESSSSREITFVESNGTYNYTVGKLSGYRASQQSGALVVAGDAVHRTVVFAPTAAATYPLTVSELGLPSGTSWAVIINGTRESSTTNSIEFNEPNGSFKYAIAAEPGYVSSPSTGQISVAGAAVSLQVNFSIPIPYMVTFQETGLPPPPSWAVTISGVAASSNGTNISFRERNGTFNYTVSGNPGFQPDPSAGAVIVDGSNASVSVAFTPSGSNYSVTLLESGLPVGAGWTASVDNTSASSSRSSIQFMEPNGTYSLNVTPVAGDAANYSTTFQVAGAPLTLDVQFVNVSSLVTFYESGLPAGAKWEVTLVSLANNGTIFGQSAGNQIDLWAKNGTYSVLASGPSGYRFSISSVAIVVRGTYSVPIYVSFAYAQPTGSTASGNGWLLPTVASAIAVFAIAGGIVGFIGYRRSRSKIEGERWVSEMQQEGVARSEGDDVRQ
jgi:YVTN family beta-propeller protein